MPMVLTNKATTTTTPDDTTIMARATKYSIAASPQKTPIK
jgi:hypothetical protein